MLLKYMYSCLSETVLNKYCWCDHRQDITAMKNNADDVSSNACLMEAADMQTCGFFYAEIISQQLLIKCGYKLFEYSLNCIGGWLTCIFEENFRNSNVYSYPALIIANMVFAQ